MRPNAWIHFIDIFTQVLGRKILVDFINGQIRLNRFKRVATLERFKEQYELLIYLVTNHTKRKLIQNWIKKLISFWYLKPCKPTLWRSDSGFRFMFLSRAPSPQVRKGTCFLIFLLLSVHSLVLTENTGMTAALQHRECQHAAPRIFVC